MYLYLIKLVQGVNKNFVYKLKERKTTYQRHDLLTAAEICQDVLCNILE